MNTKGRILTQHLMNQAAQVWTHAWGRDVVHRLVTFGLDCTDFHTGKVASVFERLDDPTKL